MAVAAVLGMAVAATQWWLYFDVVALVAARRLENAKQGEERNRIGRDSFSYLHFPMVAGIVLVALGMKKTLGHTDEALKVETATALLAGSSVYLLAHVAFRWRNIHTLNRQRLVVALLLPLLIVLAVEIPALATLAILTAVMCRARRLRGRALRRGARAPAPPAPARGRGLADRLAARAHARVEPHDGQVAEQPEDDDHHRGPQGDRLDHLDVDRRIASAALAERTAQVAEVAGDREHPLDQHDVGDQIGAEAPNSDATVTKEAGAAWRRTTRRRDSPLAHAVSTYFSPSASMVIASVSRRIDGGERRPDDRHGKIIERTKSHGLSSGGW